MTLRKKVLFLSAALIFDTVLSFLVPILLTRLVDVVEFGEYRFFWLAVGTLIVFAPLGMEQALVYFLARSPASQHPRIVGNTLLYLHLVAVLGALFVAPWNLFISNRLATENQVLLSVFSVLYLTSLLLDFLPLANHHASWHARNVFIGAITRVLCIIVPVWVTHHITSAFYGLLVFSIVRLGLLAVYARHQYGRVLFPVDRPLLFKQLTYGIPFGLAGAFYTFRTQAEQWIVSGLFHIRDFAVFSVSLLVIPVLQLLYLPLAKVILPKIHALVAAGDLEKAHALNRRVNVSVGFLTYPLIFFSFFFADKIVAILFPEGYGQAANVMRVYLVAQFRLALEGSSMLQALGEGHFSMRLGIALLIPSVLISWYGATHFGLVAAAMGSVVTILLEALFVQHRLTKLLRVPFADIQDWGTHAKVLAMALLSNGLALFIGSVLPVRLSPFMHLLITGFTMVVSYLLLSGPFRVSGLTRQLMFWRAPQIS